MGVYIKEMNKPTDCFRCPLRTGKYCGVLTENERCVDNGVLPHCPITEVKTPHGRLIDADAVTEKMWQAENESCFYELDDVVSVDDIDNAPTVIERED